MFWANCSDKAQSTRAHSVLTRNPCLHCFYFQTISSLLPQLQAKPRRFSFKKTLSEERAAKRSCKVTYLCTRAAGPCRSSPSRRRSHTALCVCHTCSSPSRRSSLGPLRTARSIGLGHPGRSPQWEGLRTDTQKGTPDHIAHVGEIPPPPLKF